LHEDERPDGKKPYGEKPTARSFHIASFPREAGVLEMSATRHRGERVLCLLDDSHRREAGP
jgi:hypothetical protein